MALKNVNPTQTNAWAKLDAHFEEIKNTHLRDLFANNSNRKEEFNLQFKDINIDYSKNRIDGKTKELLRYFKIFLR